MRARVWFHRGSAVAWLAIGAVSFRLGWQDSVALVWAASVYANIKSDWAAAEAADDSDLQRELGKVTARLEAIERRLSTRDEPEG